jgi:hypothetical protein
MARPRKTIPMEASVNMCDLATKIASIPDEELGAWLRKAVNDWQNGCAAKNEDEFVRNLFEKALEKMNSTQKTQANKYKKRIAHNQTEETTNGKKQEINNNAIVLTNVDERKPYGTCQHVMLTADEGRHLREVYGPNLETAIDILDAYIENNGKAAKKYKNHAAVLRKGNWVWHKVQDMILQQARLDRAQCGMKSFKQADRDERTRFFMDTSVVDRMIENESKAI